MTRRSQARGFTMIEVLIALVLLATVAAAIMRTMQITFETKHRVEVLNERYNEGRQIMVRLTRELGMAFLRAEIPEIERTEDPNMVTRFKGEEDEVYFASTSHLRLTAGAPESDQTELAYFLRRGDRENGFDGKTLYRRESRRVDGDPERGGYIYKVVEGVKEFRLEYWDDTAEIGDDAWQRDWDSRDDDLMPARIRITLELELPGGGHPVRFVSQAKPRIRRPINIIDAYQRPGVSNGGRGGGGPNGGGGGGGNGRPRNPNNKNPIGGGVGAGVGGGIPGGLPSKSGFGK